ncbi:MAG: (2Fe-2S)-binding protein [Candidatus Aminicenantes bacterium]|nr:MAG: (2Fe-2S)-binding protein [Candidatus Aminicenantes bacterium]
MVKIFIDEKPVEVEEGTTILKAAEKEGISIPHLCYHSAFPPEGSCRMCLVEIEGLPKLELACSTQVRDGMKVFTKSEKVVEARKGVLEFLLAEHPLDCPICDKAGDCKLQDYYDEYGLFESQFRESKEKREKKDAIGKSLLHDEERCILCRRCVRFLREVTQTQELGVFERGIHSRVNIYDLAPVDNNYSGNLAQICPVGAITDKDFRFKTRSWFLKSGESICPLCSRGCSITIEYHPGHYRFDVPKQVYRINSRENQEVNGFWICDLGRYGYSYLNENRQEKISLTNNNISIEPTWESVRAFIAEKLNTLNSTGKISQITLVLNTGLSNEELFLLHKIFRNDLNVNKIFFADPPQAEADDFLLNAERSPNRRGAQEIGFDVKPTSLKALTTKADFLLMFGSFISGPFDSTGFKDALKKTELKILFTPHVHEMNSLFDIIFPTALIAEKEGSLTNVDGKVQRFAPIFEAPEDSLSEWNILTDLGQTLGINSSFYKEFTTPESVSNKMKEEIPFFREEK